ncbi:AAA family ATPase [Candidatus Dependentiae bacterium]|nr:AAA family ATPase [Candidatus Dependentiae bacterium]
MKKFTILFSCLLIATTNLLKPQEPESSLVHKAGQTLLDVSSTDLGKTVRNAFIYSTMMFFALKIGGKQLIEYIIELNKEKDFKVYQPGEIKESFASIAGYHKEKQLFQDIITHLKDPKKYEAFGAQPPKGILLTGAPGTGKTLLVRALAGEANCSIICGNGADFASGPSRIKKIFDQAKAEEKPCIIFLDEFELIALNREKANDFTVIALLTELDGFVKDQKFPIIVIAATNLPEKIDTAVLRPGRISHKIHMDLPNSIDRKAILQLYLSKIEHEQNMDLSVIVQFTAGLTASELADIVQSSARIAINNNQSMVTIRDLEEALNIQQIGILSDKRLDAHYKKITAYHEAGHALISILTQATHKVTKITIIPRGNTGGITQTIELNEEFIKYQSKEDALNSIATAFGGRAAEEIIFNLISTGPYSDLQVATQIATKMIQEYGMGNNLMVAIKEDSIDKIALNQEVNLILNTQYQRTVQLLNANIDKLHKLAQALLEKETLYGDEIYELLK